MSTRKTPAWLTLCAVPGCHCIVKRSGHCSMHAQRIARHGDPLKTLNLPRRHEREPRAS